MVESVIREKYQEESRYFIIVITHRLETAQLLAEFFAGF